MNTLANFFSNPLVAFALSLFQLVLAVTFFWLSKRLTRLCYRVASGLDELTWNEHLVGITVAIWNGGSEPLRNEDIAGTGMLRLQFDPSIKLLRARVRMSAAANMVRIFREREQAVELTYAYLNPGDGAVLWLVCKSELPFPRVDQFHTGIVLSGHLVGAGSPTNYAPRNWMRTSIIFAVFAVSQVSFVLAMARAGGATRTALAATAFIFPVIVTIPVTRILRRRSMPGPIYEAFRQRPDGSTLSSSERTSTLNE